MKKTLSLILALIMTAALMVCAASAADTESAGEGLTFCAEDLNGNMVTQEDLRDAKLIMLNLWEPWCGPCVREMPDLQALYEKYVDQGLVILGAFTYLEYEEEARALVEELGITYPIVKADDALNALSAPYVPCTRFFTGEGVELTEEPYISARSFEEWEAIILELLEA